MSKKESSFCETCEQCGQRKPDVELRSNFDPDEFDPGELFMLCNDCVEKTIHEV